MIFSAAVPKPGTCDPRLSASELKLSDRKHRPVSQSENTSESHASCQPFQQTQPQRATPIVLDFFKPDSLKQGTVKEINVSKFATFWIQPVSDVLAIIVMI